ncbi:MAG: endonuclease, partial [Candidatus Limisoma sp.]|nr:endonuclease [Candidatus Limisoma sp.]
MKNFKNIFAALLALSIVFGVRAAAPSGYYSSAEGKSGKALLEQLCTIINSHTVISYKGLWEAFKTTDLKANGKIWDMYSTKEFSTTEQCGNYTAIGDCYNREHSFPKSWFNDASPMYSDLFHLYPTDGYVNNQRGNYPFGECANGTKVPSKNGVDALGRLGRSTFSGYTGTVWEPDDEYKGDFARTYFYMAACYNTRIASWSCDMLAGNSYPAYTTWAINLLMKWHEQDPVSEKETKRNDAVYSLQKNRNPFIDYPELADYIWGGKTSIGWTPGGVVSPKLVYPADGATFDMGVTLVSTPLNYTVTVKGTSLTKDLAVTVSGTGLSTTTTTVSAAAANSDGGASVVVTFTSATETSVTGTIKVSSSEVSATATLKAQAVSSVPALAATNVEFDSFNANWQDILADGSTYQLYVYDSAMQTLTGYPKNVAGSLQT